MNINRYSLIGLKRVKVISKCNKTFWFSWKFKCANATNLYEQKYDVNDLYNLKGINNLTLTPGYFNLIKKIH